MNKYAIGLDFGTESCRGMLVSVNDGEIAAMAVELYPSGVIVTHPESGTPLPSDWALQDPMDWLSTMESVIAQIIKKPDLDAKSQIVGIGIDFTSCTILPVKADGAPLSALPEYQNEPHAWTKLWKHHGAQPQADKVNQLAAERNEPWLERYGNKISSEWLIPKALEILESKPEIYQNSVHIIEGADWIAWQLSGTLSRNACCAGYKGTWHKKDGFPSQEYLKELHPQLEDLYTVKFAGPVVAPGAKVGQLSEKWAKKLGLSTDTVVAGPIIDAHSAAIGGGVSSAGTMFMIMGTSTCHLIMSKTEQPVLGISGVVEDGIVPGLFGYEAGQAGVGDIFAWFVKNGVPADYQAEANDRGTSIHELLSEKASQLMVNQHGLLALDWWNGCRTPLVDADLTGMLIGYTLATPPEAIYRALIESTAYGTHLIIELFKENGVPVNGLRASGGLTKNPLLMQIYADVIGQTIEITATEQASALGAAILGAVGGGAYGSIEEAVSQMTPPTEQVIQPNMENHRVYTLFFNEYKRLVDMFGRDQNSPLKRIRELRI